MTLQLGHPKFLFKTFSLLTCLMVLPQMGVAQAQSPVGLADPDADRPKVENFRDRMEIRFEGPANWFWYDAMENDYSAALDLAAAFPIFSNVWLGVGVGTHVVGGESVLVGVPVKAFAKAAFAVSMGAQAFVEISAGVSLGSTRLNADYLFTGGVSGGVELALGKNMSVSIGPRIEYISDLKEQSLPVGGFFRFSTYL